MKIKLSSIILWLVSLLFFVSSLSFIKENKYEELATGFVLSLILFGIGVILSKSKKNIIPVSQPINAQEVKDYNLFDDLYDNQALQYQYEEKICTLDIPIGFHQLVGGEDIFFKQEPENTYDAKAIGIYFNNCKIGYVYKGVIQDMIHDWINRGDYFRGYVNKIIPEENKITYKIGFYKPLENYEYKSVSLIKTKKRIDEYSNREDNLFSCKEGETVILEYDYDSETYIVFNYMYEEIGEINRTNTEKLLEKEDEGFKLIGLIDEITESDSGTPKARIKIYFVK